VGAPSLTAAKPRLSVADSSSGWGLGEGEPSYTPVSPDPAFLATAAPWEPYFTDNRTDCKKNVTSCFCFACLTAVELRLPRDGMQLTHHKESHVCYLAVQTEAITCLELCQRISHSTQLKELGRKRSGPISRYCPRDLNAAC
jgi:hypothetical protein